MSPKKSGADRETLIFLGVVVVCVASLAVHGAIAFTQAKSLKRKLAKETSAAQSARAESLKEAEAKYQAALADAEAAVSEGRAARVRQEEFRRRQAMEPGLAKSPEEKRLVEMARPSQDGSLDVEAWLQKLAKAASPKSSGIRVSRAKKAYSVEVAVLLSEVPVPEHGGKAGTSDLQREVRRTVAGIIRDLFAFGAGTGLQKVEVSCMKMAEVRGGADGAQYRQEFVELYRADLALRPRVTYDWPALGRTDVLKMMSVKHDEFGRIMARR